MSRTAVENTGQRFFINLAVRAEWNEQATGKRVVVEGTTENIGPEGAMVSLSQLPAVGSRIQITITGAHGRQVETRAEVVRLVRDLNRPLASLFVLEALDKWRGQVWEPAGILAARTGGDEAGDDRSNEAN